MKIIIIGKNYKKYFKKKIKNKSEFVIKKNYSFSY